MMATRARIVDDLDLAYPGADQIIYAGVRSDDDRLTYYLLGAVERIGPVRLAALRRPIAGFLRRRERESWFESRPARRVTIGVGHESDSIFQKPMEVGDESWVIEEYFGTAPVSPAVSFEDDEIFVSFTLRRPEEPDADEIERVLTPFVSRQKADLSVSTKVLPDHWDRDPPEFAAAVEIRCEFQRGATLTDAFRLGEEAKVLVDVVEGDEIPHRLALDLLRAGRWNLFKGRPESDWLEAKGAPYAEANRHLGKNWKYELAKDVAAFANSPEGGIIVIGMTTADDGDGEVINGFREFDLRRVTAGSYGNYVAQHIHPRVEGFEVARLPGREPGRGIVALAIPRQDPSSFPFLVRGVVRDGEVLGNHILWPVRQGDQTAILDADGLHARLRLGDQVMKGRMRPRG
jgi:hypothetical protein